MYNPPQSTANNSRSHTSEIRPDESQRVNAKIQSVGWKEPDAVEWRRVLWVHTHTCTHKHAFYHSITPLATKWGCKPVVCLCVVHIWFSKSIYAFKGLCELRTHKLWECIISSKCSGGCRGVCVYVFSRLSGIFFNGSLMAVLPWPPPVCTLRAMDLCATRWENKPSEDICTHTTHARSLKTKSGLSIIQQYNDYAFNYYNCISPKHLYISDISVDHSYNSSKHA